MPPSESSLDVLAVKDGTCQQPIPSAWRPVFRAVVAAFAAGDYLLSERIPRIETLTSESVAGSKVPLEEKFYNVKISQDGHLAWVSFDFEFLADGKVENYGVESWQLLKASDDRWKIMTVIWSSHGAPKQ